MINRWPHAGAFVLKFRLDADPEAGPFEGRVEHVASGRAAPFHALEELRAFLARALAVVRAEEEGDPRPGSPGGG